MSTAKEKEALAGVEGMASAPSVVHLMGPAPSQSEATVKLLQGASHAADLNRAAGGYPGASRADVTTAYQSRAHLGASSPFVGSQPVPFVLTGKQPEQPMPVYVAFGAPASPPLPYTDEHISSSCLCPWPPHSLTVTVTLTLVPHSHSVIPTVNSH